MVVGTGFLLLVSLVLTALLTAFTHWLGQRLLGTVWTGYSLDMLVSFLVITFLFALIFKLLPDVTVSWIDVWIGTIFTAVLFMFGKFLIGMLRWCRFYGPSRLLVQRSSFALNGLGERLRQTSRRRRVFFSNSTM